MKNLIYMLVLLVSSNVLSQVGVNTQNPTRDLDINGNLRIANTTLKTEESNYNKVLVTDKNGNVDYWDKNKLLAKMEELPIEVKKLYFSNAPDPKKIVTCGKFDIRFTLTGNDTTVSTTSNNILAQIKLNSKTNKDSENIYYFYTEKNNSHTSDFTSQKGATANKTFYKDSFTNIGDYKLNQLTEVFLTYPGDINYYRILFLVRNMTYLEGSDWINSYGFSMICEKF